MAGSGTKTSSSGAKAAGNRTEAYAAVRAASKGVICVLPEWHVDNEELEGGAFCENHSNEKETRFDFSGYISVMGRDCHVRVRRRVASPGGAIQGDGESRSAKRQRVVAPYMVIGNAGSSSSLASSDGSLVMELNNAELKAAVLCNGSSAKYSDAAKGELDALARTVAAVLKNPPAAESYAAALGFFEALQEIAHHAMLSRVERETSSSAAMMQFNPMSSAHVATLLREFDSLGWDRVMSVSDDMRTVELQCEDEAGRKHALKITLHPQHPYGAPTCQASLPEPGVQLNWKPTCTIADVVNQFEKRLSEHQALWDMLDDIDANCWVLEPDPPRRSDTYRRVVVASHVSMKIQISADAPRGVCGWHLFGSPRYTASLRDTMRAALARTRVVSHQQEIAVVDDAHNAWLASRTVRENLEKLLSISFPTKDVSASSEYALECGICYNHCLDPAVAAAAKSNKTKNGGSANHSQLPDEICENPKCGRSYHYACLSEWLRSLMSTRHSFDTMFGRCPYCDHPISISPGG